MDKRDFELLARLIKAEKAKYVGSHISHISVKALESFSLVLADELKEHNVRFNKTLFLIDCGTNNH